MPALTLQHVRGHQDKHTPYSRLSLLAQLNVDADEQATRYQRDFGGHQPIVHLTPWAGVHLVLPTGTITRNYESALRYHATAPALMKTMRDRYS